MKILVTEKQDRRVMLALALLGAETVTPSTFEIKSREISDVWRDECIASMPVPNTYGPPAKGRGGKLKRW